MDTETRPPFWLRITTGVFLGLFLAYHVALVSTGIVYLIVLSCITGVPSIIGVVCSLIMHYWRQVKWSLYEVELLFTGNFCTLGFYGIVSIGSYWMYVRWKKETKILQETEGQAV